MPLWGLAISYYVIKTLIRVAIFVLARILGLVVIIPKALFERLIGTLACIA